MEVKTEHLAAGLAEPPLEDDDMLEQIFEAQYPNNSERIFECKLIEAVRRNPRIYNSSRNKSFSMQSKTEIWRKIAEEEGFADTAVALQTKWRHIRDRYVRLQRLLKTSKPSKKFDKWHSFCRRMSFLEPYIEHRPSRKRNNLARLSGTTDDLVDRQEDEGSASFGSDPVKEFYDSFLDAEPNSPALPSTACLPTSYDLTREEPLIEKIKETMEESDASLFSRSIEKTLKSMDPQTFSLARLEICRVLHNCQFRKTCK